MAPAAHVLLAEAMQVEVGATEPWPKDVVLYQPLAREQILLPDNSSCLSVQAFLHMCDLNFTLEMRKNAEYMSPTGKVPFIKANNFVIAELANIVDFVNKRDILLTEQLDIKQKCDMKAYMSLVNNVLGQAELYTCWLLKDNYDITYQRYGGLYPWPLNHILALQKKYHINRSLTLSGWAAKSFEEVLDEVNHCCSSLSERLGKEPYFFNNKPTELDALVYGHLFSISTTTLPNNRLASVIKEHENLIQLCQRIDAEFFGREIVVDAAQP